MKKIKIYLENNNFSNNPEAFTLYEKSSFGERDQGRINYSIYETLFLVEINRAEAIKSNKNLVLKDLIKFFLKKDKKLNEKYLVFRDLRKKGYIVKTGLKFGSDFRVYDKKDRNGHARWLIFVDKESNKLNWQEFAAKNRVAHSTRKKLLLAIVDEENKISYFEVNWTKIN